MSFVAFGLAALLAGGGNLHGLKVTNGSRPQSLRTRPPPSSWISPPKIDRWGMEAARSRWA
jgi:hypothetical protein